MKNRLVIESNWIADIKQKCSREQWRDILEGIVEYGIFEEEIESKDNYVDAVLKFIKPQIKNMQQAYDKRVNKGKNVGRPATIDTEKVYHMARDGMKAKEIAEVLGKNVKSIYSNQGWIHRKEEDFLEKML